MGTVGWRYRFLPICGCWSPLRRSRAGVWIEPADTTTFLAFTLICHSSPFSSVWYATTPFAVPFCMVMRSTSVFAMMMAPCSKASYRNVWVVLCLLAYEQPKVQ